MYPNEKHIVFLRVWTCEALSILKKYCLETIGTLSKSHVSCYLEMQRWGHFNIFYYTFTGQINKESEELQVFDDFFFSFRRQPIKLQRSGWKKVRVGYNSDANIAWAVLCDLGVSLLIATVHGTRNFNYICSHCHKCWGLPLKTRYGKSPHKGLKIVLTGTVLPLVTQRYTNHTVNKKENKVTTHKGQHFAAMCH